MGLNDGAGVRLAVARGKGTCRLRVKLSDATPPDVVNTGMGWWLPSSSAPDHGALDININAALDYSGPYDPATRSSDVRGLPCPVEPLATCGSPLPCPPARRKSTNFSFRHVQREDAMKADEAAEMMDKDKEQDLFKRRAAITIAILAMLLAITGLGGQNATKEAINENILASNYFNFY